MKKSVAELMQLSIKDLVVKLRDLQKELFDLNYKLVLGNLSQTHLIRETKRNIARIKTVLSAKRK